METELGPWVWPRPRDTSTGASGVRSSMLQRRSQSKMSRGQCQMSLSQLRLPLTKDTSSLSFQADMETPTRPWSKQTHGETFGFMNILLCFRSLTLSLPLLRFSHPEHNRKIFTGKLAGCLPEIVTQEGTVYLQRGRKR